jgi:hypothetical protein
LQTYIKKRLHKTDENGKAAKDTPTFADRPSGGSAIFISGKVTKNMRIEDKIKAAANIIKSNHMGLEQGIFPLRLQVSLELSNFSEI